MAKLEELLIPAVESLGYMWWGCVLQHQAHNTLLRIYIDKPGGVGIEDCAATSHQVSGVLAVANVLDKNAILEISSPGLDRPLYTPAQYNQFIAHKIKVRLRLPLAGQRNFQGIITAVEEDCVALQCDANIVRLPFDNIERANVVPDYSQLGREG